MRGHGHDRAGAVARQHVIGDPNRYELFVHRIDRVRAGEHAALVLGQFRPFQIAFARRRLAIRHHRLALRLGGERIYQFMLRRQHHVRRPKQRIRPCGKNDNLFAGFLNRKCHFRAFTAANPIPLHLLQRIAPVDRFQIIQQPLSEDRDPQHPLAHWLAHHRMPAHLALAIDHLLIGQHRAQLRAPVHRRMGNKREPMLITIRALSLVAGHIDRILQRVDRLGLIGRGVKPRIVQLQKNPLAPLKITGLGGVRFPTPIIAEAQALDLPLEISNIFLGRLARMLAGLDRVLLGGQAKGIPAHRMQHMLAAHALKAREDIGGRVAFRMPHV